MKNKQQNRLCHLCLFLVGGLLYTVIELLWRGRTHWSMFIVGGICFRIIGWIYHAFSRLHWFYRSLLSALAVTVVEGISGYFLNMRWHMQVWSYAGLPLNLYGQVCLLYSFYWAALSIPTGYIYKHCQKWLQKRLCLIGRRA